MYLWAVESVQDRRHLLTWTGRPGHLYYQQNSETYRGSRCYSWRHWSDTDWTRSPAEREREFKTKCEKQRGACGLLLQVLKPRPTKRSHLPRKSWASRRTWSYRGSRPCSRSRLAPHHSHPAARPPTGSDWPGSQSHLISAKIVSPTHRLGSVACCFCSCEAPTKYCFMFVQRFLYKHSQYCYEDILRKLTSFYIIWRF